MEKSLVKTLPLSLQRHPSDAQVILDKKIRYRVPHYLIKWRDGLCTWQSVHNLSRYFRLIFDYDREQRKNPSWEPKRRPETSKGLVKDESLESSTLGVRWSSRIVEKGNKEKRRVERLEEELLEWKKRQASKDNLLGDGGDGGDQTVQVVKRGRGRPRKIVPCFQPKNLPTENEEILDFATEPKNVKIEENQFANIKLEFSDDEQAPIDSHQDPTMSKYKCPQPIHPNPNPAPNNQNDSLPLNKSSQPLDYQLMYADESPIVQAPDLSLISELSFREHNERMLLLESSSLWEGRHNRKHCQSWMELFGDSDEPIVQPIVEPIVEPIIEPIVEPLVDQEQDAGTVPVPMSNQASQEPTLIFIRFPEDGQDKVDRPEIVPVSPELALQKRNKMTDDVLLKEETKVLGITGACIKAKTRREDGGVESAYESSLVSLMDMMNSYFAEKVSKLRE